MRRLLPEFAHLEKGPFRAEPAEATSQRTSAQAVQPASAHVRQLPPTPPPTTAESSTMAQKRGASGGKFQFWYIGKLFGRLQFVQLTTDAASKRVEQMYEAMVRLDPNDFIALRRVEFLQAQKNHAFVSQLRLVDVSSTERDGHDTLYGYIEEDVAPPRCSKFDSGEAAVSAVPRTTPIAAFPTPVSDDEDWVALPSKGAPVSKTMPSSLARATPVADRQSTPIVDIAAGRSAAKNSPGGANEAAIAATAAKAKIARPGPRLSSHVQPAHPLAESSASAETQNLPEFDLSKAIVFPAGSYEIVLILDTREIESKSNRDRFAEKLAEKGVNLQTRALRLGDVCWVAKRFDGIGGEEDECVLDYVLERKRLDDLCSSIRDGRYNEQCVRLTCKACSALTSSFGLATRESVTSSTLWKTGRPHITWNSPACRS